MSINQYTLSLIPCYYPMYLLPNYRFMRRQCATISTTASRRSKWREIDACRFQVQVMIFVSVRSPSGFRYSVQLTTGTIREKNLNCQLPVANCQHRDSRRTRHDSRLTTHETSTMRVTSMVPVLVLVHLFIKYIHNKCRTQRLIELYEATATLQSHCPKALNIAQPTTEGNQPLPWYDQFLSLFINMLGFLRSKSFLLPPLFITK